MNVKIRFRDLKNCMGDYDYDFDGCLLLDSACEDARLVPEMLYCACLTTLEGSAGFTEWFEPLAVTSASSFYIAAKDVVVSCSKSGIRVEPVTAKINTLVIGATEGATTQEVKTQIVEFLADDSLKADVVFVVISNWTVLSADDQRDLTDFCKMKSSCQDIAFVFSGKNIRIADDDRCISLTSRI